jgi:uncharacterized protein (TIGR02996 family)
MPNTRDLEALLRASKADPTDDDVRRILADYLEDMGEVDRAEFVRLQIDSPEVELDVWDIGRAERDARQSRLLRKHAREWLGGSWCAHADWCEVPGGDGDHIVTVRFVRGLADVQLGMDPLRQLPLNLPPGADHWLETVLCGQPLSNEIWRELCRGPYFDPFSTLGLGWPYPEVPVLLDLLDRVRPKGLWLNMANPRNLLAGLAGLSEFRPHALKMASTDGWSEFAASPALSEVRSLFLALKDTGDALRALAAAPHLEHLRDLRLSCEGQDRDALEALLCTEKLASVRELVIGSYNGEGNAALGEVLSATTTLRSLKQLDLFMNPLDDEQAATLAGATVLESVRVLKLHSCALTPTGAAALFASPHLGQLEHLDLSCNPCGDATLSALASVPGTSAIRHLELSVSDVSAAGLRTLAESPRFAHIEELALGVVTDLEVLATAGWESLRSLSFDGQVSPDTWRTLTRWPGFAGLIRLSASCIGAGPAHAADLASAPGLMGLLELEISLNPLGRDGAAALAGAPWLDRLVSLNLYGTDLDDDGLIELLRNLKSGTLANLHLQSNQIGQRGGRALLEWPGLQHLVRLGIDEGPLGKDLATQLKAVVAAGPH